MKIITWNVNGIRAVERKNELQNLLEQYDPDILKIQEIKGNTSQFSNYLTQHPDYYQHYHSAEKAGYSGTAIWVKKTVWDELEDAEFTVKIDGAPNQEEGRVTELSFQKNDKQWHLFSIYFPNGGKSEQAWQEKLVFFDAVLAHMDALRAQGAHVLVGGDMNVAHTEIDIARPKENDGKIGFHPLERAWVDRVIDAGFVDVWRERNPSVTDVYSWWHMVTRGRERNVGWRIDYFFLDKHDMALVGDVRYLNDQMGSDHCPILLDLDI